MKKNNKKSGIKITSVNMKKIASYVVVGALVIAPPAIYYNYESQKELWCPSYIQSEEFTIGEDGGLYYYFAPGEHTILISRNDAFPHKIEKVEGYEIVSVEVNSWRDNNKVKYVNTKPVMVKLTGSNEEISYFDEFGTVIEEDEYQKILEKKDK